MYSICGEASCLTSTSFSLCNNKSLRRLASVHIVPTAEQENDDPDSMSGPGSEIDFVTNCLQYFATLVTICT